MILLRVEVCKGHVGSPAGRKGPEEHDLTCWAAIWPPSKPHQLTFCPPAVATMAEKKVITRAQVAEHKTNKDCWFVIHGEVYDVTKFLDEVFDPKKKKGEIKRRTKRRRHEDDRRPSS